MTHPIRAASRIRRAGETLHHDRPENAPNVRPYCPAPCRRSNGRATNRQGNQAPTSRPPAITVPSLSGEIRAMFRVRAAARRHRLARQSPSCLRLAFLVRGTFASNLPMGIDRLLPLTPPLYPLTFSSLPFRSFIPVLLRRGSYRSVSFEFKDPGNFRLPRLRPWISTSFFPLPSSPLLSSPLLSSPLLSSPLLSSPLLSLLATVSPSIIYYPFIRLVRSPELSAAIRRDRVASLYSSSEALRRGCPTFSEPFKVESVRGYCRMTPSTTIYRKSDPICDARRASLASVING